MSKQLIIGFDGEPTIGMPLVVFDELTLKGNWEIIPCEPIVRYFSHYDGCGNIRVFCNGSKNQDNTLNWDHAMSARHLDEWWTIEITYLVNMNRDKVADWTSTIHLGDIDISDDETDSLYRAMLEDGVFDDATDSLIDRNPGMDNDMESNRTAQVIDELTVLALDLLKERWGL